jgi:lysyl-tRNA synthetase, class I
VTTRRELAIQSKAWPFQEAAKLLDRFKGGAPEKGYALFETGYGPSGLPHIGTFGEVARTTMVKKAFEQISDIPTRLFCISDDMDGLRKVPANVPNRDMLEGYLNHPLSKVPDPFDTHESFGAHNNARLMAFLDEFGFDYEFLSSSECYAAGRFDATLLKILKNYEKVVGVILPTLGEERRKTYSPFLPICPVSGEVLQVPLSAMDADAGTISFIDSTGEDQTIPVTGGTCKLQWKADWAMRWDALDVDYEMAGKDLIESVKLSGAIRRILGSAPPAGFSYELFLDENGEKISKSRGNGLSIEEWLRYAAPQSLSLYMFQSPRRAKRLFFDIIPKTVDEYYAHLAKYSDLDEAGKLNSPIFHIHHDQVPDTSTPVAFALLLNLVSASNTSDKDVVWGFVSNYASGVSAEANPALDRLIDFAITYYRDFVGPTKVYRLPAGIEVAAFEELAEFLRTLESDTGGEDIQTGIYEIGKAHPFDNLRDWFKALYQVLLGQPQGPRMGNFIALYGIDNSLALLDKVNAGEILS